MTAPLSLDFYTVNFQVVGLSSYMYVTGSQRQSGVQGYQHKLGPGSYMIQPVFFGAGRGFRLNAGSDMLYRSPDRTGWSIEKMQMITVLPGETTLLSVQEGSVAAFRQADLDAKVQVALNITRIPTYIP